MEIVSFIFKLCVMPYMISCSVTEWILLENSKNTERYGVFRLFVERTILLTIMLAIIGFGYKLW
jgi:hypothetical protein